MRESIHRRALLGAAAAWALASTGVLAAGDAAKPRTVNIVAKKFEFVPGEIRVRKGETVVLAFTAPEVPMGVNFADFQARADVMPGKVTTLQLTPDKVGTFTFLCDVFCGSGHEDMNGLLVVTE
jgi:cytochrome c oxidase subunit 2